MNRWRRVVLSAMIFAPAAAAQAQAGVDEQARHAAGADLFYSTDAEDTDVVRAGLNLDFAFHDAEDYRGIRLEKAWFNPSNRGWRGRERVYLRGADRIGKWKWSASVGTDGDTVLGSASIHDDSRLRKEAFVEREIVETPQGLSRGIYSTFGGVAFDLPLHERNIVTLVAGVQDFSGNNVRTHLRANYIHMVKPEWGLSAQLRTRWFRNSDPREYDYYSPRWYGQILPVLQVRRFTGSGWRYLVAGGLGVQRDSDSNWRRSSYFNAQLTSSPVSEGWAVNGAFLFSETPTATGRSYNYVQLTLGLSRAFR